MFSRRLAWPCPTNRLAILLDERRRAGAPILDLTESNPTRVGLDYPEGEIAAALADPGCAAYDPQPRGLAAAREAVAADFARRGLGVGADRIVLTAGTSEAYGLLFKMLADPGETVLVPRPGYPLFEYLAGLESLRVAPYPIAHDGRWHVDVEGLERAAGAAGRPAARAVVLVDPHNPTGAVLGADERRAVERLCAERGMALIADEVFADYLHEGGAAPGATASPADAGPALRFALGGLSKSCGLPQMKLGWIAVDGPEALRREAIERLEIIADTYLSVGTPVQRAAGRLLDLGGRIRDAIRARLAANRAALRAAVGPDSSCRALSGEGGWYEVLQVPAIASEENLVLGLLEHSGVLVHPGYFFDFEREAYLVLSLLPEPGTFSEGVGRILARVGG